MTDQIKFVILTKWEYTEYIIFALTKMVWLYDLHGH